jgi:transketolase
MRKQFAAAIISHYTDTQVFITGDLGYMALEAVREKFGERFINAGVAEQNMVSMAAGMAREGLIPWLYSISPFITLRPYEQIRNDVCLHKLPVKLVGNGGGYGYGIMGSSHHNLEDIGIMRILPNMKVYVPFVEKDVDDCVVQMLKDPNPNYLRLNIEAKLKEPIEPFRQWRKIKSGTKAVVIGTGPVLANLFKQDYPVDDIEIWVVSLFPITALPEALKQAIRATGNVITIEEHSGQCGLNETLAERILSAGIGNIKFNSLYAHGYPSGYYGDQNWHQEENSLSGIPLTQKLKQFIS